MGRIYHNNDNYITSTKPNGFEITGAGPIDNRLIVEVFEDLIDEETFAGSPNVAYEGMVVSVLRDGMSYMLIDKKNITDPKSWVIENSEYIVEYTGNLKELYPGLRYNINLPSTLDNLPESAGIDTPLEIECECIYPNNVNAFEILIASSVERQILIKCVSETGTVVIDNWANNVGNTGVVITLVPGKKYMICVDKCKDIIIGMYCEI